jgi:adenylate cyclase
MAEVELAAEDEAFEMPPWAGEEVSDDPRYLNVNLARKPFNSW